MQQFCTYGSVRGASATVVPTASVPSMFDSLEVKVPFTT